jgi:hypothetical protein
VDSNAGSNNRFIGSSLNTVVHTCPTTYASHTDPVTDHYQYFEWLLAPYTFDGTTIYSLIHSEWYGYVADKSCAMNGNGAWLNAITYASSNNSGASFTQPSNYLILRSPTEWSSTFPCGSATNPGRTQFGDFGSSNIIPKDGYYWSYFIYGPAPGETGKSRECLMRTNNLADPQSWEVWNGAGYSRGQEVTNCAAIDGPTVGSPSIRYSTYLHAYISIGWNLTYRTSKDLITWSAPKPIAGSIPADLLNQTGGLTYASLLDPNDASMNFDNVGQTAYIYFTVMHGGNDRDIYRVKVQFNDGPLPVPPPNQMPIGAVGAATSTSLQGWAYDPNASSTPITISIYVGGTRFSGTEIASYTTDQLRTDVNGAQGITGTHGFRWSIPSQYLSAQHTWFVYAKDNELNTWSLLAGSPRTNVIITPTPTTTPPTATIDAISLSATAQTNINVRGTATHATIITVNSVPVTVTNGNWSINLSPRAAGTYPIAVYDSTGTRLLASGVITVGALRVNQLPVGVLGAATSTYLQGWAYDPDATSTSDIISIYMDGPQGTGVNVEPTLFSSVARSDVAAGVHGYNWPVPTQYQTGTHSWYVYARDMQTGSWKLLSGSPKTTQPTSITAPSFLGANATPVTVLNGSVPLCNSAAFSQVPTNHNLFIGRVLQNTTTTPCNGSKWGLGLFQMNWATHTLTFLRYVLQPPVSLSTKTLTSVYDPSVVSYNGELWVSFECGGFGIIGASSCVGPLNLTNGIDLSRTTILANGTASDPTSLYYYSASVPNLFVFNGNLYVYWSAIRSVKATGKWESVSIRGMQLTKNSEGKLWGVNSGGKTVSSYDPAHNVEIAAPDPSDPLSNTSVDLKGLYANANGIYLVTSLGGYAGGTEPCVKPNASIPGCWRMQIFHASAPLAHINLAQHLIAPALPSNPTAYQRFLIDPSGAQEIIGAFAPASASASNVMGQGLSLYPISLPSLQFNGTSSLDSSNLLSLTAAAIAAPLQAITDALSNLFFQLGVY